MTPPDRAALERVMADAAWADAHPDVPLDDGLRGTWAYRRYGITAIIQLAALEAAGCVVMPVEATDEIIYVGDEAIIAALNEHPADVKFSKGTPAERCYAAQCAASPFRSRT